MNSHHAPAQLAATAGSKPAPGLVIPDETVTGETIITADSFHQAPVIVMSPPDEAPAEPVPADQPPQESVSALDLE